MKMKFANLQGLALRLCAFTFALCISGRGINAADLPDVEKICGAKNMEDLAVIGKTRWVIGSSMAAAKNGMPVPNEGTGTLVLVDRDARTVQSLTPADVGTHFDSNRFPSCSGPLPFAQLSPHGVDLRPERDGTMTLYVVNHSKRQSIEVYRVDARGKKPTVDWIGCSELPSTAFPSGVAALPDGGLLVTSTYDQKDAAWKESLASGKPVGSVYRWDKKGGWREISVGVIAGLNGPAIRPDGKIAFVSGWSEGKIYRLDLAHPERTMP